MPAITSTSVSLSSCVNADPRRDGPPLSKNRRIKLRVEDKSEDGRNGRRNNGVSRPARQNHKDPPKAHSTRNTTIQIVGGVRGIELFSVPRALNSSQHALSSSTTSSLRTLVFSHASIRLSCAFPFTEVNDRFKFFVALPPPVPETPSTDAVRRRNIRDKNPGIVLPMLTSPHKKR